MSKLKGDPGYRGGWCIHYIGGGGCEAGVPPETWKGTPMALQPCFLKDGHSQPDALPCEHLRRPTQEEMDAHKVWADARMQRTITVMQGIAPWREKWKGKSHQEVIECPACKGRLHLSIAAYNGHMHARCETDGCVAWMQ